MRYRVVAVGRMKDAALRSACDGYLERLRHYARIEEHEVKDDGRVLGSVADGERLVALSRRGAAWTSRDLAGRTERWDQDGRDVTLAIGGAVTLPPAVFDRAEAVWSLSPLTLPHELVRVVVYEQLYRAFSIRRGEPYHRGP